MSEYSEQISIYPVGWLERLQRAGRCLRRGWFRLAWREIRHELGYTARQARAGNWRAVKNTFDGYLAEHHNLGRRCGTGWTKRRALADLYRHLAEEATTA